MLSTPNQNSMRHGRSLWLIAGRIFIAAVFLAGASYNVFVTLSSPVVELGRLVDLSPMVFIRELVGGIVLPHATIFVIIVILFELSIAVSVLLGLKARRYAYAASLAFFVVLLPLIGWYALSNLIWALPVVGLVRYDRGGGRGSKD